MLLQGPVAYGVWRLLGDLYPDSASQQGAREYASLSETEKRTILRISQKGKPSHQSVGLTFSKISYPLIWRIGGKNPEDRGAARAVLRA
jgi:hypothetical protein